ncbi:MAG: molybdopterin-dependent oxidoreductase [Nitrospiria bacterium]
MEGEDRTTLKIDGAVEKVVEWDYESLLALPEEEQVEDVSKFVAGMLGSGVRVKALVNPANPLSESDHATFHSQDGRFVASVPSKEALEKGILIYKRDGGPLPEKKGGPLRLAMPHGENECANVKSVIRIEMSIGKGLDTTFDPDHDNPEIHGHSHDKGHSHGHDHNHGDHDHTH